MNRRTKAGCRWGRHYGAIGFAIMLVGALSVACAELAITDAALSGGSPVTVNKMDGTTVRGTVSQCTPELLFVTPAVRPSPTNKPPVDSPEPPAALQLPWKQIRTVSDGLSPRIAMDIWMAQHADQLCPTCRGERTVWCPVCKGTRHDPAAAVDCPTCKGELLVDCKTAGEVKGQIPCPNSCLKLGVGQWAKQPDGLMWRTWRFGRGTQTFSERHLGDVMILDPKVAKDQPPISDQGKCPICGGTTRVNDPACFGTGQVPCKTCLTRASAPPCPNHCDNGRVVCPTCKGTGLKTG